MRVSTSRAAVPAEELQVHTYQFYIQKEQLTLQTPFGYGGRHDIRYQEEGLHYRTLMTFANLLRENRLREAETQLFGEYLYDVLLNNEAGEVIHQALKAEPHAFLRVELHFEDDAPKWLLPLPWEYLYRPSSKGGAGYFLATKDRLALVRCPFVGSPRSLGVAAGERLRILLVACSPSNLETLEFGGFIEEMKALTNVTLTTLITRHVSDVNIASAENPNPQATFANFTAAMSDKPHIVHFLGHGRVDRDGGSIAFVRSGYDADWVEQKDLQPVFEESEVRLAFLQACETAASGDAAVAYRALSSVAGALAETGIPAIVAMQAKIQIGAASSFASRFYNAIVKDRVRLFRAMQVARAQAGDAARIPVLYLRYEADRKDQADLLFEDAPSENKRPGPSRADAVNVEGPKCPWCAEELTSQQLTGDRCPYCGSDLCCPKCGTAAQGPFPKDRLKTFCTKRGCPGELSRMALKAAALPPEPIGGLPRGDRPGAPNAPDVSAEQTFGRARQKDPFFAEPASESAEPASGSEAKGQGV